MEVKRRAARKSIDGMTKPRVVSLYKKDTNILEDEGPFFNFSAFVRFCLRDESMRSKFMESVE